MFFHFRDQFPQLNKYWDKYLPFQQIKKVPAKALLLAEGKKSQYYIFIEKGCVRTYINKNGEEKTIQFFFENEGLTSFDSFVNNVPSLFSVETIEPSVVYMLHKKYVMQLMEEVQQEPGFMQLFLQMTARRQFHYVNEFVSILRDTPEQRYQHLLNEKPWIIQRVPQHYIASYLGVSSVHMSRIKNKVAKGKAHF